MFDAQVVHGVCEHRLYAVVVQLELAGRNKMSKQVAEYILYPLGNVPVHEYLTRADSSDDRLGNPRVGAAYPEDLGRCQRHRP